MRICFVIAKYLFALVLLLALGIAAFVNFAPTFGAAATGDSLARIQASDNFRDGLFHNLVATLLDTSDEENPRSISAFFSHASTKNPNTALPSQALDTALLTPGKFVWLGHSTVLFNVAGKLILTDPVFHRASPVPFIGEPFAVSHVAAASDLPALDVVLISHDHYDHLDHLAIQQLDQKTQRFLVPLGLRAHLEHWGVASDKITEFDWYDSTALGTIRLTFAPTRHFSGRGISNRFSTLWGSWIVQSPTQSIYFSGDSGYFDEFEKIGENYGPFDIAFVENGAYNTTWAQIHMLPEEAVQASVDLKAELLFPIHWGKFDLALHPWDEPIQRATKAAKALNVRMATPLIGEVFSPESAPNTPWWSAVK